MRDKGKDEKIDTGQKAVAILAWIVERANDHKAVVLTEDWGGFSLTVALGVQSEEDGRITPSAHTHVGSIVDDGTIDQLIDSLHSTVTGSGGLSWA